MAYTLSGRLQSRLAGALVPLLAACVLAAVLPDWWPVELAGLMLGVGLLLDFVVYDRVLDYQPGWLALPLGLLELGIVVAFVRALSIGAPLAPATSFPWIIPIDISVIVIAWLDVALTRFPCTVASAESMTIPCPPPTTVQPSTMLMPLSAEKEMSIPCV